MNRNSGSKRLCVIMLLFGLAALVLRIMLYSAAVDRKGLLLRNHPLTIALAALTGLALTILVLAVRKLEGSGSYEQHYSADLPGAFGNMAAGAGILVTVLACPSGTGAYLENVWRYLGLAAPVCFCFAGIARTRGKIPFFALHVTGCLFLVLHIVTRYQLWSGNPQIQDYIFSLLGAMALMFFAFYTAAMEAGYGRLRMQLGMGLAAVYLCTAELARSGCPWLYLGGILWVLTDLGSMQNVSKK